MIRKLVAAALLIGLLALWAYSDTLFPPETISGPVLRVRDGDTIDMNGETTMAFEPEGLRCRIALRLSGD